MSRNQPSITATSFVWTLLLVTGVIAQDTSDPSPGTVWALAHHESAASLRGLCVVDRQVVWATGTAGTVLRSVDGGQHWETLGPPDCPSMDFRDVHAFDQNRAIIAVAGAPARIYRTDDGGASWQIAFEDLREGVFFDALSIWDDQNGIVFSDPINNRFLLVQTNDGGKSWQELDSARQPVALDGEAGFAASGTCLCVVGDRWLIGLGGQRVASPAGGARILKTDDQGNAWEAIESPLASGEASGIFSIAFANRDHGVAVGGNYTEPDGADRNACFTTDGGAHWQRPVTAPGGYRSGVAVRHIEGSPQFVCVGPTGCDMSVDGGKSWQALDSEGFHAIAFSADGQLGIATGADGKIGVWRQRQK
jgi:photosystem II stability/assembly factor-like uncharacterized protein